MDTALDADDAIGRITHLLQAEGVEARRDQDTVRSLRTPMPFLNIDFRLYSRRNWVGINPFALLTAIVITASAGESGTTLEISIDRRRMFLLLAIEALVVLTIAFSAPVVPTLIVAVILFGACGALLRLASTLTRSEIERQLQQ